MQLQESEVVIPPADAPQVPTTEPADQTSATFEFRGDAPSNLILSEDETLQDAIYTSAVAALKTSLVTENPEDTLTTKLSLVDDQLSNLAPSDFLDFPDTILADIDQRYELIAFNDSGYVVSGIVLGHTNLTAVAEHFASSEGTLPQIFDFLHFGLDELFLEVGDTSFADGSYRQFPVRYYNTQTPPLSLDYVITDEHIIVTSSSNMMHLMLDELYPPAEIADDEEVARSVRERKPFGRASITPDFNLVGSGKNMDSPAFWENPSTAKLKLFVSSKSSEHIEIWDAPFGSAKPQIFDLKYAPNGLALNFDTNELLIADTDDKVVRSHGLPGLSFNKSYGGGKVDEGENNVAMLNRSNSSKILYITDDDYVLGFDYQTGNQVYKFKPDVSEIEEVQTDDYYQMIYVPDEQGSESKVHKGGAILMFHPDGRVYSRHGKTHFGEGLFLGDAEGTALYKCLDEGKDTGDGLLVFADQIFTTSNQFHIFDRRTLTYYGALTLVGVTGTDGIDIFQGSNSQYPDGVFAALNNDKSTAVTDWRKILEVTDLSCF